MKYMMLLTAGRCVSSHVEGHEASSLRFQTDASVPGVERLSVTCLRPDYDLRPLHELPTASVCPDQPQLLKLQGVLFIKGWTRSVALDGSSLCLRDGVFLGGLCVASVHSAQVLGSTACLNSNSLQVWPEESRRCWRRQLPSP